MKIVVTTFLFIVVVSCNQKQLNTSSEKEETKIDSVKSFILKTDSAQKIVSLLGNLLPNENIQIRAKVQGYIKD